MLRWTRALAGLQAAALCLAAASGACHVENEALDVDAGAGLWDATAEVGEATTGDANASARDVPSNLGADDGNDAGEGLTDARPPFVAGPPAAVGCADGTREAFLDLTLWPDVAGCAGGFDIAGLVGAPAQTPMCDHDAGDSNPRNPTGVGCDAADLCAAGWAVCALSDFAARAKGACELALPAGVSGFFAAAVGATTGGVCAVGGTDDLHGCGTWGQPESPTCAPFDHRMDVFDCEATHGAWSCGDTNDHLDEASLARKPLPTGGGVLCCRAR